MRPTSSIGEGWLRQSRHVSLSKGRTRRRYTGPCGTQCGTTRAAQLQIRRQGEHEATRIRVIEALQRAGPGAQDEGPGGTRKRDHSSRTAAQMTARRARGNNGAFKRDIIAHMFRNETTHADDCRCRTSHHDNRVWGTAVKSMIRRVSDQCTTDGRAGCWGLIDCEKSVCESRESQRECDTLSQLQTPRQLVVLAQPP